MLLIKAPVKDSRGTLINLSSVSKIFMIHKKIGGDIADIETIDPYTGDYNEVVEQGQREVQRGFKPEIEPLAAALSDYDTVAVGTPTWWYTMAPAVLTFLTANDWTGKTVIPFMTNGGWPGHVIKDMDEPYGYCGMPCALCTRYRTAGASRCPGCSCGGYYTEGCKVYRCCREKGLAHCGECAEFPCARLGTMLF